MTCGRAQRASNRIYIPKAKDLQVKASHSCKEYQKISFSSHKSSPAARLPRRETACAKWDDVTVFSFKFSFGYFFPNELLNITQMGEGRLFCQKRGETSISYPDTHEIEAWHFLCKSRLPTPTEVPKWVSLVQRFCPVVSPIALALWPGDPAGHPNAPKTGLQLQAFGLQEAPLCVHQGSKSTYTVI